MKTISAAELQQQLVAKDKLLVFDVRSPEEYLSGHIPQAINYPLECIDAASLEPLSKLGELIFVCKSGARSKMACERAQTAGVPQVGMLTGGTDGWRQSGFEICATAVAGPPISIERQVRIGAGLLILLGVVLGFSVSSTWFLLSGFVGLGLTLAGITDWCGMGLLLARMPWNRRN
ncbi:MAG: rhodanese-like domain-containing protein [Bdellovibrionales bacterium]|nr:rhodanese-like domain-containing protein [Bdellovibrionales bacterium]